MEWISVKDRLPEYKGAGDEQIVIVTGLEIGRRYVYYARAHDYGEKKDPNEIFSVGGWSDMNVTHWMPLPDPPEDLQQN